MSANKLSQASLVVALVFLAAGFAHAITIETVPVGNPGNAGELSGEGAGGYGPDAIVGSVDYEYMIGKYEVTNAQYVEFLNAVAASDPHGLYNTSMSSSSRGCKIQRSGSSGSYAYSVAPDRANRPVNYVSWYDAARFSNWLATGDTETGVYTFTNGSLTSILNHDTAAETLVSTAWFIPTEDEWYKAAYHKNDGVTGNYFDYPTGSDTRPSNDLSKQGNNANYDDNGYTIGSPYYMTEVGEFENSESPYGTFDQGGNIWEWVENAYGSTRGLRGGGWHHGDGSWLDASWRYYDKLATYEDNSRGFRVACIPESGVATEGDLNSDGIVGSHDLDLVRVWWLQSVEPGNGIMGDATGDGLVNSADLDLVRANWGAGLAAVPEPGVFLLTLVGAVLLVWRRRV